MHILTSTLWLPKFGNSSDEYEDAAWPLEETHDQWDVFRCAVADGATETSFSGQWAQLLVKGYADETDLAALRKEWLAQVSGKELSWYAQEKLEQGAYAAFAGLTINDDGTWTASAVGDSCIIQTRDDLILTSFPLDSSHQFNNRPFLLASKSTDDPDPRTCFAGQWQEGDVFLLMTDAIARYFLARQELHEDGMDVIGGLSDAESIQAFADENRKRTGADGRAELANDDLTLMRVTIASK